MRYLWFILPACEWNELLLRGLTFELTPTAEAGGVSPVTDDATNGGRRAYAACRSGSGVERGVRRHRCCRQVLYSRVFASCGPSQLATESVTSLT